VRDLIELSSYPPNQIMVVHLQEKKNDPGI